MNKYVHLQITNKSVPIRIDVVQYATKPNIVFVLDDYEPTGTASLYIEKPDGTKIYNACTIDGNQITYEPTTQSFAVLGVSECQLQIVEADGTALSFIIYAEVTKNIVDASAIESQDEFTALEQALQTVSEYDSRITQAQTTADSAQATANTADTNASTALDRLDNLGEEKLTFEEASVDTTISDNLTLSTIFGRIKRLFTRVKAIEDVAKLKTTTIRLVLNSQTWTQSGVGKYYLAENAAPSVTGATKIYAVSLTNQWQGLRATDVIQPIILPVVNKISLIANTNSFHNDQSAVEVQILYI